MDFMRRWTLTEQTLFSNNSTQGALEGPPQLDIIAEGASEHRVRKRDLFNSVSSSDNSGSSHPKRRKTSSSQFSLSNFLFSPVKAMYSFLSGQNDEAGDPGSGLASGVDEAEASTSASSTVTCTRRATLSKEAPMVDLTNDSNNQANSRSSVESDTSSVFFHPVNVQRNIRRRTEDSEHLDFNDNGNTEDVEYIETRRSPSSVEKQDEEDEVVIQFVKEVERQDEANDVEIVAEVCNFAKGTILADRKSVESVREQVTSLSSSISSPERSSSSLSAMEGRAHDQISTSPAPEDSISRQGTPYGLRLGTTHSDNDPWKRRRPGIQKAKFSESSGITSFERNFARLRDDISPRSGATPNNVNLLARDCLLDMLVKMGGNKVIYPAANKLSFLETVNKTKPFRKTKRVVDGYDGINRVRSALDKCLPKNSTKNKAETNDLNKSFERQSSSEQMSESSLSEAVNGEDPHILSNSEIQSSRSTTPASEFSAGVNRITELLEKLNNIGQRPTPDQKYSRFAAERQELRDREIELQEEVRIRHLARQHRRERIQEQTRRRLELLGIRPPTAKPKIKDEFPPLSAEVEELCQRIWNRRLPESEELTEAFGFKLTRKDLSTLSGLDWLNDEVINFYLQLVCQRSMDAKDLPKVYAFNTFFYASISTKGYASVKRWTRKVDIFAYDILLVPIHLSVHWCVAVIDLAERRIDYYDSLLGRNQKCLDLLKNYLIEECKDKKKQIFDFKGWQFNLRTDIPRQMNGSDCGVFLCKFAEFASRRAPIVFTQQHMPYYRRRMLYELVKKKLL